MGHKYMSFGKNSLMPTMAQLQFLVHPTSIKFDVRAQPSQPHNDSFPTPTNDNVDTPHHTLLKLSPKKPCNCTGLSELAVHYAEIVVYIYPISTCALKGKEYLLQFLCRCFVSTANSMHKGGSRTSVVRSTDVSKQIWQSLSLFNAILQKLCSNGGLTNAQLSYRAYLSEPATTKQGDQPHPHTPANRLIKGEILPVIFVRILKIARHYRTFWSRDVSGSSLLCLQSVASLSTPSERNFRC